MAPLVLAFEVQIPRLHDPHGVPELLRDRCPLRAIRRRCLDVHRVVWPHRIELGAVEPAHLIEHTRLSIRCVEWIGENLPGVHALDDDARFLGVRHGADLDGAIAEHLRVLLRQVRLAIHGMSQEQPDDGCVQLIQLVAKLCVAAIRAIKRARGHGRKAVIRRVADAPEVVPRDTVVLVPRRRGPEENMPVVLVVEPSQHAVVIDPDAIPVHRDLHAGHQRLAEVVLVALLPPAAVKHQ